MFSSNAVDAAYRSELMDVLTINHTEILFLEGLNKNCPF